MSSNDTELSLCPHCHCMTKTIAAGRCGKCKENKMMTPDTQNDTSELREAVKRFCRTDEATDNLVRFIAQREQAAELWGRIDELGKTTEIWIHNQHEDDFSDYLQRRKTTLKATKPEKGTEE